MGGVTRVTTTYKIAQEHSTRVAGSPRFPVMALKPHVAAVGRLGVGAVRDGDAHKPLAELGNKVVGPGLQPKGGGAGTPLGLPHVLEDVLARGGEPIFALVATHQRERDHDAG